jgi:hypothetical protein
VQKCIFVKHKACPDLNRNLTMEEFHTCTIDRRTLMSETLKMTGLVKSTVVILVHVHLTANYEERKGRPKS